MQAEMERLCQRLVGLLCDEPVSPALTHPAEAVLDEMLALSRDVAWGWINHTFGDYQLNTTFLTGLATVLGRRGRGPDTVFYGHAFAMEALDHPDPDVRRATVEALAQWGDPLGLVILETHHDSDPGVTLAVAKAITDLRMGPKH